MSDINDSGTNSAAVDSQAVSGYLVSKNVLDKLHLAFDLCYRAMNTAWRSPHFARRASRVFRPYSPTSHHIMSFQQHNVRSHMQSQSRFGNEICPAIQKMPSWLYMGQISLNRAAPTSTTADLPVTSSAQEPFISHKPRISIESPVLERDTRRDEINQISTG